MTTTLPSRVGESEAAQKAALARAASRRMGSISTSAKNAALLRIADEAETDRILAVNGPEVERGRERGLTGSFIDRMVLTPERIAGIARDVRTVAALPDPVGEMIEAKTLPNGLQIGKIRVPLGVLGAIYESRPNVTVDIAVIALKSGNGVVLRSGTDAHESSAILAEIVSREAEAAGLPAGVVQFIDSTDRDEVGALLRADRDIDLMVPPCGADLIRRVRDEAKMPVVAGGIGVCHTFVDESADLQKAVNIVINAKTVRPSVCNAMDTLLVHSAVAERFIPLVARALGEREVLLHVDERAAPLVGSAARSVPVLPEDYDREWLGLECSVKVVDSLDEAMDHIAGVDGSGHSEAIVTESYGHSQRFLQEVDAAAVFVNASTYFNDGGQFGLGCEVGISTQKMHARGPMGLRELTSYKWIVRGDGHVRS
jgi:glutamate-5-semialdehyde dehydrogenase